MLTKMGIFYKKKSIKIGYIRYKFFQSNQNCELKNGCTEHKLNFLEFFRQFDIRKEK